MHSQPADCVEISDPEITEVKRCSLYCHTRQAPDSVWKDRELVHFFRGRECGVERPNAYVSIDRTRTAWKQLPIFDGQCHVCPTSAAVPLRAGVPGPFGSVW